MQRKVLEDAFYEENEDPSLALNQEYGVAEKPQIHLHYDTQYRHRPNLLTNFAPVHAIQTNHHLRNTIIPFYVSRGLTINHCPDWVNEPTPPGEDKDAILGKVMLAGDLEDHIGSMWLDVVPYLQVNIRWRPNYKMPADFDVPVPAMDPLLVGNLGALRAVYVRGERDLFKIETDHLCEQYTPEAAFHYVETVWRDELAVDVSKLWATVTRNYCLHCGRETFDEAPLTIFLRGHCWFSEAALRGHANPGDEHLWHLRALPVQATHPGCFEYAYTWLENDLWSAPGAQGVTDDDWDDAAFGDSFREYDCANEFDISTDRSTEIDWEHEVQVHCYNGYVEPEKEMAALNESLLEVVDRLVWESSAFDLHLDDVVLMYDGPVDESCAHGEWKKYIGAIDPSDIDMTVMDWIEQVGPDFSFTVMTNIDFDDTDMNDPFDPYVDDSFGADENQNGEEEEQQNGANEVQAEEEGDDEEEPQPQPEPRPPPVRRSARIAARNPTPPRRSASIAERVARVV